MSSAQSASIAAAPGYVSRPVSAPVSIGAPAPAIPTLPTIPTLNTGGQTLPNELGRTLISNQLAALPGQESNAVKALGVNAKQALAGYGGYSLDDNGVLTYDPNHAWGQREIQAAHGARDASNAAHMLSSSFANQNIAGAVQRTSLEGQQVANQYAASLAQTYNDYFNQGTTLVNNYASLYGQDATWALQNPPPTPALPANDYNGSSSTNAQLEQGAAPYVAWAAQGTKSFPTTGPNPVAKANGAWGSTYKPTYAQWLKSNGLTSNKANAATWTRLYG